MRTLVAIMIVVLIATSAFARKAYQHHSKRSPDHQSTTKTDSADIARHPDDVALDRKIGSICRGC